MGFFGDIRAAPLAHDQGRGQRALDGLPGLSGPARDLIFGAAGSSAWIAFLLQREGDFAESLAVANAGQALAEVLAGLPDGRGEDPGPALRRAKRQIALLSALADLGGVWDLDAVTMALTAFADRALAAALTHAVLAEAARGRGLTAGSGDLGGAFALAMGKMGAGELNFSSDIDLIFLFDEERYPAEDLAGLRAGFIRAVKAATRLLSESGEGGYVFRTDLRLRPDPAVTPVIIGADHALHYYESLGRGWERAAYIKARVAAGDAASGAAFLQAMRPFVWRRHLDFAAIGDAHDIRRRLHEAKGLFAEPELPGLNLKLAPGGIRDIEFFTQTHQLIHGGRDPALRPRGTVAALQALAGAGRIGAEEAADLQAAYAELRRLEHRIQMMDDAQSHHVPLDGAKRDQLARLSGAGDTGAFLAGIEGLTARVRALTGAFFGRGKTAESAGDGAGESAGPAVNFGGFAEPAAAAALVASWEDKPALRSARARAIFARLLPGMLARLARAADPDAALRAFGDFLAGLPAGVQVFALFDSNPAIPGLLAELCAVAPRLADYLGRNARVFDAVIGGDFFAPLPGRDPWQRELTAALAPLADPEERLNAARRLVKEAQFRIGAQLLSGLCPPHEAGQGFAALAEAVLEVILPEALTGLGPRHGSLPGAGAAVLAMGKLGAGTMTATSDLDLIVIYEPGEAAFSDGPRPLSPPQFFARATQGLVNALSAPTAEGWLYKVDMRLRPSGQKGPAAVSLPGFAAYQRGEARTWEHLALTRARVVAGPDALRRKIEAVIEGALTAPRDAGRTLTDVAEMRGKLEGIGQAGPWDLKRGPGRLLDLELFAAAGMVLNWRPDCRAPGAMFTHLAASGWLKPDEAAVLSRAHARLEALQMLARLALEGEFSPERAGRGLGSLIARQLQERDMDAVFAALDADGRRADQIITARLNP